MDNRTNKMLIDATHPEETRVVVLRNGRVEEFDYESAARKLLRGNIYLAKVTRVEPSLQAAFVEYGGNRHGFLAFNEIHPDYYQIPMADRQALIEEEAAAEAEADAEADARAERRHQSEAAESRDDEHGHGGRHEGRPEGRGPRRGRNGRRNRNGDRDRHRHSGSDESGRQHPGGGDQPHVDAPYAAGDTADAAHTDQRSVESGPHDTSGHDTGTWQQSDAGGSSFEGSAAHGYETDRDVDTQAGGGHERQHGQHDGPGADTPHAAAPAGDDYSPSEPTSTSLAERTGHVSERVVEEYVPDREPAAHGAVGSDRPSADADVGGAQNLEADVDQAPHAYSDENAAPAHDTARDVAEARRGGEQGGDGHIEEVADTVEAPETIGATGDNSAEREDDPVDYVPERPRRQRRRQYKIQEVIKRRQIILVQVVKEERGNKGAALTTYLSLAGRYTVLMPNTARGGGISRKIVNSSDRKRLKSIAQELDVPEGMGLIIRTAGAARTNQEIKRDYEYLLRLWESVRELTLQSTAPSLVYEEGNLIKRSIRDLYSKEIDEIVVAGDQAYQDAHDFMRMLMPSHVQNVIRYQQPESLFARYPIERQLAAMFSPYVTLPSGGYLVINQTEALVAIDINSGKSTREYSIEETALQTNLEASDEIARQLKLRDLAGLIVIDFIDMEEKRNNRAVERRLADALRHDRARIQLGRISHFGLLEMSRQRMRTGVLEGSTTQCSHCQGTGMIRSTESIALAVLRGLEDHLVRDPRTSVNVLTTATVALYILNNKRSFITDIERRHGISVAVQASEKMQGANFAVERSSAPVVVRSPERTAVSMDWAFEGEDGAAAGSHDDGHGHTHDHRHNVAVFDAEPSAGGERQAGERGERQGGEGGFGDGGQGNGRPGRRKRRRGRGRDRDRGERGPRFGDDGQPLDQVRQGGQHAPHAGGEMHADAAEHETASAEPEDGLDGDDAHAAQTAQPDGGDAGTQHDDRGSRRGRRRGRRGGRRNHGTDEAGALGGSADTEDATAQGDALLDDVVDDGASDDATNDANTGGAQYVEQAEPAARAPVVDASPSERHMVQDGDRETVPHIPPAAATAPIAAEPAAEPVTIVPEPAPRATIPVTQFPEAPIDPSRPPRRGWWKRRGLGE